MESAKSFPTDLNKDSYSKACKDTADTYKQAQKQYSEKIETDLKENGSNPKTVANCETHC